MSSPVYKVLIADDEYWTREKLRKMIEWDKYSMECLEPAVDGEDVLRKIQAFCPDILLTDINMPYINGVELINILSKEYPEIVVVVISGYDDFAYVRDTLTKGAINYLIKPVSKMCLVNTLSKALEIISEKEANKRKQEETKSQLIKASSLIQDSEFSFLLNERFVSVAPNLTINVGGDFSTCSLLLVKIHNLNTIMQKYKNDVNLFSYSIKQKIKQIFCNNEMTVFNHVYCANEFIILTDLHSSKIRDLSQDLLSELIQTTASPITIVINHDPYSVDNIRNAYLQVSSELLTRPFSDESCILSTKTGKASPDSGCVRVLFDEYHVGKLIRLVKTGNFLLVSDWLRKKLSFDHSVESRSLAEEKQIVKIIINTLIDMERSAIASVNLLQIQSLTDMAENAVESLNSDMLFEVVIEILNQLMETKNEYPCGSIQDAILQAVNFIDNNYTKDLSLVSLSKQFGIEQSYFSRMFRQQKGETLILYITQKRIDKAIEYIRFSDESLTEIAFIVGYDDYSYFSRVFRKITGKSPRDFRNEVQTEKNI